MWLYSRGQRGVPAKDVGHLNNDARVRISPATFICYCSVVWSNAVVLKTTNG